MSPMNLSDRFRALAKYRPETANFLVTVLSQQPEGGFFVYVPRTGDAGAVNPVLAAAEIPTAIRDPK